MGKTSEKGYQVKYPERPFLIYPVKYNELLLLLPICFVMFFIKGGGWIYSILLLIIWFIIAIHWTKTVWIQECNEKGHYELYFNGEPIRKTEETDFHLDPMTHRHDELHFMYDDKKKRWESHEEVKQQYDDYIKQYPRDKEFYERLYKSFEEAHKQWVSKGW